MWGSIGIKKFLRERETCLGHRRSKWGWRMWSWWTFVRGDEEKDTLEYRQWEGELDMLFDEE